MAKQKRWPPVAGDWFVRLAAKASRIAVSRAQIKTWSADISARRGNPSLRQPGRTPALIIVTPLFTASGYFSLLRHIYRVFIVEKIYG